MTNQQRKMFAEKLADLANLAAGALVFGQFVSGGKISTLTILMGIILAVIFYFGAYIFSNVKGDA